MTDMTVMNELKEIAGTLTHREIDLYELGAMVERLNAYKHYTVNPDPTTVNELESNIQRQLGIIQGRQGND